MDTAITGIGDGLSGIIGALESFSVLAGNYASKLITAMLILEIALLGYMIAIGKVNNGAEILWKVFTVGVCLYVAAHIRQIAATCLDTFMWFVESICDTNFSANVKNPAATLIEIIGNNFTTLWTFAADTYKWNKMFERVVVSLCAFFMVFIMMFAIINYYLAYIHYLIALIWGTFMFPFTLFKPLHFIGENVIKGIFGHILKLGIIYFTLTVGIVLMRKGIAVNASDLTKDGIMLFLAEKIITCLVVLYIIKASSAIAGEITCGTPGQSGLSFGGAVRTAGLAASVATVGSAIGAGKTLHSGGRVLGTGVGAYLQSKTEGKTGMQALKMGLGTMGRKAGQEFKGRMGELGETAGNAVRRMAGLRQSYSQPRQSMSIKEAFASGQTMASEKIAKQSEQAKSEEMNKFNQSWRKQVLK